MRSRHAYILFLVLEAVMLASCSRGTVIPRQKMARIYADFLLADQWIETNSPLRKKADTTNFYLPILRSYGFDENDYRASVDYYLQDPLRFSRMMKQTRNMLNRDLAKVKAFHEAQDRIRQEREAARATVPHPVLYDTLFSPSFRVDTISLKADDMGRYLPEHFLPDTLISGPEGIGKWSEAPADTTGTADIAAAADKPAADKGSTAFKMKEDSSL